MVTVVTRWPLALEAAGGWGPDFAGAADPGTGLTCCAGGRWRGRRYRLAEMLAGLTGSAARKRVRPNFAGSVPVTTDAGGRRHLRYRHRLSCRPDRVRLCMTTFEVWAPGPGRVDLLLGPSPRVAHGRQARAAGGASRRRKPGQGTRYLFSLDGGPGRPDPRSGWQPDGIDGPSAVVDHREFVVE